MRDDDVPSTGSMAGWAIKAGAALLLVAVVLGAMYVFGWGMFQRSTAEFRGETGVRERVVANPAARIAAYEHFFDLCASIQAREDAVRTLEWELETLDEDSDRAEQVRSFITANRTQRDALVRRYNTDARQGLTAGQFRDEGLPAEIDINEEETTCTQ